MAQDDNSKVIEMDLRSPPRPNKGEHGLVYDSLSVRLEQACIPDPNSGCWHWVGAVDANGYGWASVAEYPKIKHAHRLSYIAHKGPIPEGGYILHSCDEPSCINPDHLRVGSHRDNQNDRVKRNRSLGPRSLSADEIEWARRVCGPYGKGGEMNYTKAAAKLGVHPVTLRRVLKKGYVPTTLEPLVFKRHG